MLTTNKSSSELTNKIKNQMIYSNYLIQKQAVNQGCLGRIIIEGGSGAKKEAAIWTDIQEGQAQTSLAEQTAVLTNNECPTSEEVAVVTVGGSMFFDYQFGSSGSSIRYPNDSDLAIGTDAFTIEWFQYSLAGASFPRIFSIGTYPTANIAVSYEGGDFLVWFGGISFQNAGSEPPQNEWVHVALVGNGTTIKVYVNGSLQYTSTGTYNFTNTTTALAIGNETNPSLAAAFSGNITNFRWVVGTQVYTGNFNVPTTPLEAISGTQLLLLAENSTNLTTDSSSANRTPTNTGVVFEDETPF